MEESKIVEAALFISSRPLTVAEISKLLGVAAHGYVETVIKKLADEYNAKGSSLEIAFADGKYAMRVRREYLDRVKPFAQDAEISHHALQTLAYINNKPGMKKSDLVKQLGASVYQDVFELVEKGFITQKKSGRTSALVTTDKFRDYFAGEKKEAQQ